MSVIFTLGRNIVVKISQFPSKLRFSANCLFFGHLSAFGICGPPGLYQPCDTSDLPNFHDHSLTQTPLEKNGDWDDGAELRNAHDFTSRWVLYNNDRDQKKCTPENNWQ